MKNQPARRRIFSVVLAASVFSTLQFGEIDESRAQSQTIEEAVQRLARRAAALPHERRVALVWSDHEAVSEQREEELKALFVAQLEAAQIRVAEGETVPALRVSIERTPSRVVLTALVPGEGATKVVIEELPRTLAGGEAKKARIRLEKEEIWQTDLRVLSAVMPSAASGTKQLVVLTEEAVQLYGDEQSNWKLVGSKTLPGARPGQRDARGQLVLAEENPKRAGVVLPGRRCEVGLEDDSSVTCVAANVEWPTGRLLANPACGVQTWLLKSDATDWTTEDHLLLRNAAAGKDSAPVAELSVPGPVQSISLGADTASAIVVVRNLLTGNYEVYRVALSCGN